MSSAANFQLVTFDGHPSSNPAIHTENEDKDEEAKDRDENAGEEVAEGEDAPAAADNNDEEFDEGEFLADEDSEEDDIVVTIGELKTNFQKQQPANAGGGTGGGAGTGGKLELDSTPSYKGAPIYDIDLATMEDKPWRKPGADITDYFNYGFNEDTWNQYCERQKKLRSEFGSNQEAVNRALFNSISISTGHSSIQQQLSSISVGRQLVNIMGGGGGGGDSKPLPKINKVVIDLSKPPPMMGSHDSDNKPFGQPISTISTLTASLSSADGGIGGFSTPPPSSNPIPTTATPISNHSSLISVLDSSVSKQQPSSPLPQQQDFSKPPPTPLTDFSKPPPSMASMVQSPHHHQKPSMTMAPPSQQSQPIPSMTSLAPAVAVAAPPLSVQTSVPLPLSSVSGAPPSVGGNQGSGGSSGLPPSSSLPLTIQTMSAVKCEAPPGVDEPEPPGVSTPPPGMSSVPSMNFNPNVPPPGLGIGVSPMNVPPPSMFSALPHSQSYSSGPPGTGSYGSSGYSRPMPLLSSGERRERDRRSRSRDREDRHFRRSRSPRDRKKTSNRDRERSSAADAKDKGDREKERSSKKEKTRKRSRSISPSQSSSKKSKKSSHYS